VDRVLTNHWLPLPETVSTLDTETLFDRR